MSARVTNKHDISLALAVWLLSDNYDYIDRPDYASATALMRPVRQLVLGSRAGGAVKLPDVMDRTASVLGTAIHDSIEKTWLHNYRTPMKLLGYPDHVINRIIINPTDAELENLPDAIPIYLEQRGFRTLDGFTVGGKFDMVAEGLIQDTKSTSVWAWIFGTKDKDYQLQGSIYRWIDAARPNPWVTEDYMRVNFFFTDWRANQAKLDPKYPQAAVQHRDIPLLSLKETEDWIRAKRNMLKKYANVPESELPECTDEELWRSDPEFKYYKDPTKLLRATRNFGTLAEAQAYQAEKGGGQGIIKSIPGEPKRCNYCEAFNICTQKDKYFGTE